MNTLTPPLRSFFYGLVLFVSVFVFALAATPVEANAGPPANIRLTVLHDGHDFQLEFLIKHAVLTPSRIEEGREFAQSLSDRDTWQYHYFYAEFPEVLIDFQDADGFVSNTLYGDASYHYHHALRDSGGDRFALFFRVPLEFKISAVFDDDVIVTSEFITMSQYDFHITWDLRGIDPTVSMTDAGTLSGLTDSPFLRLNTWLHFFARLIVTLAIELAVLWVFGFRRQKTFVLLTLLNIFTQTALTWGTIFAFHTGRDRAFLSALAAFILGEVAVFLTEILYTVIVVKERSIFRRLVYSLTANLLSLMAGFVLMMYLFSFV